MTAVVGRSVTAANADDVVNAMKGLDAEEQFECVGELSLGHAMRYVWICFHSTRNEWHFESRIKQMLGYMCVWFRILSRWTQTLQVISGQGARTKVTPPSF